MSIDTIIKKVLKIIYNFLYPYLPDFILNVILSIIKILIIIPLSIIQTCYVFATETYELLGEIWEHMIYYELPNFFINQLSITQEQFFWLFSWNHHAQGRGVFVLVIIFLSYFIPLISVTNINKLAALYQRYPTPFSLLRKIIIIILVTPVIFGLILCYILGLLLLIDQFLFQLLMEFNYPLLFFMLCLTVFFYML